MSELASSRFTPQTTKELQDAVAEYANMTPENRSNYSAHWTKGEFNNWDVSNINDMSYLFYNIDMFNEPIGNWNVSKVTTMSHMFHNAKKFNQLIDGWDVSNVADMSDMFHGATEFNKPLNGWGNKLRNLLDMSNMFDGATKFNKPLNEWVIIRGINRKGAFNDTAFEGNPGDSHYPRVIEVSKEEMDARAGLLRELHKNRPRRTIVAPTPPPSSAFYNDLVRNFINQHSIPGMTHSMPSTPSMPPMPTRLTMPPIPHRPPTPTAKKVTTPSFAPQTNKDLYKAISAYRKMDIKMAQEYWKHWKLGKFNDWDVSKITNMRDLFKGLAMFNEPLDNWDVSNVTDMSYMFAACQAFNQPLDAWGDKVGKVTTMFSMFKGCMEFDQPLNNWNVSSVTNMSKMFLNCSEFDHPINNWDVSKVTNMESMFEECNEFNKHLNRWNVINVVNMKNMFKECNKYNQPLNSWDVSKVTNMDNMFEGCKEFNQPLPSWNVANVVSMDNMFKGCLVFKQDLTNWIVRNNKIDVAKVISQPDVSRDYIAKSKSTQTQLEKYFNTNVYSVKFSAGNSDDGKNVGEYSIYYKSPLANKVSWESDECLNILINHTDKEMLLNHLKYKSPNICKINGAELLFLLFKFATELGYSIVIGQDASTKTLYNTCIIENFALYNILLTGKSYYNAYGYGKPADNEDLRNMTIEGYFANAVNTNQFGDKTGERIDYMIEFVDTHYSNIIQSNRGTIGKTNTIVELMVAIDKIIRYYEKYDNMETKKDVLCSISGYISLIILGAPRPIEYTRGLLRLDINDPDTIALYERLGKKLKITKEATGGKGRTKKKRGFNNNTRKTRKPRRVRTRKVRGGAGIKRAWETPSKSSIVSEEKSRVVSHKLARHTNTPAPTIILNHIDVDASIAQDSFVDDVSALGKNIEIVKERHIMENFVELEVIGKGGFGVVCKIENKQNKCVLVAKKVQIEVVDKRSSIPGSTRDTTMEILNEINVLKKLKDVCSRYILCFEDFYMDNKNNTAYIVTEYLDKYVTFYEFSQNLTILKRFTDAEKDSKKQSNLFYYIARIIDNLVKGLALIHSKNIVHRDIKSMNLLLDIRKMNIKYIDFGLACDVDNPSESKCQKIITGTFLYLDPYYIKDNNVDLIKVDYWALGLTIFEFIHGKRPIQYLYEYLDDPRKILDYFGSKMTGVGAVKYAMNDFHSNYSSNIFNAGDEFDNNDNYGSLGFFKYCNDTLVKIGKAHNLGYVDLENLFGPPEGRVLYL